MLFFLSACWFGIGCLALAGDVAGRRVAPWPATPGLRWLLRGLGASALTVAWTALQSNNGATLAAVGVLLAGMALGSAAALLRALRPRALVASLPIAASAAMFDWLCR